MTTNTGGPAFPCTEENYRDPRWTSEGLSLRDYFAAKAIEGACNGDGGIPEGSYCNYLAESAYKLADAMLKARG
jgi:hypothetical protein